jgi:GxxExxY protein
VVPVIRIHEQLTRRIIGYAMEVHRTLKNGFQEVIDQRALAIEFDLDNLRFEREQEMEIYY